MLRYALLVCGIINILTLFIAEHYRAFSNLCHLNSYTCHTCPIGHRSGFLVHPVAFMPSATSEETELSLICVMPLSRSICLHHFMLHLSTMKTLGDVSTYWMHSTSPIERYLIHLRNDQRHLRFYSDLCRCQ